MDPGTILSDVDSTPGISQTILYTWYLRDKVSGITVGHGMLMVIYIYIYILEAVKSLIPCVAPWTVKCRHGRMLFCGGQREVLKVHNEGRQSVLWPLLGVGGGGGWGGGRGDIDY